MRSIPAFSIVALVALSSITGARANDQDLCAGKGKPTPEQQVQACSAMIASPGLSPHMQAIAYNNRAAGYNRKEDHSRALQDLNQAIRLRPDYALAYRNRGDTYRFRGRYDLALRDYNEAIRLDPNSAPAFRGRGLTFHLKASWDFEGLLNEEAYYKRAVQDYEQAIQLSPGVAINYILAGDSYAQMRRYDVAVKFYDKAISLDPSFGVAYVARAIMFRKLRQTHRAIADYKAALRLKISEGLRKSIEASLDDLGGAA